MPSTMIYTHKNAFSIIVWLQRLIHYIACDILFLSCLYNFPVSLHNSCISYFALSKEIF